MRLLLALATVVLWCSAMPSAQAHGGAYDMKYVDGANVLLLTFNTHEPVSGIAIEHDLRLYDLLGAPIPYDEVAVELHTRDEDQTTTLKGSTLLEKHLAPMLVTNESHVTLTYPLRGAYSLEVEFRAGGRAISAGHFAVDVGQGSGGPAGFPWIRLGLALLLGVVVGVALPRGAPARRRASVTDDRDDPGDPGELAAEPASPGREPVGTPTG